MHVTVVTKLIYNQLSEQELEFFSEGVKDMFLDSCEEGSFPDVSNIALIFNAQDNRPIPFYITTIRNPYEDGNYLSIAMDCESFDQAKELQVAATMAFEKQFGEEDVTTRTTSWVNPLLN